MVNGVERNDTNDLIEGDQVTIVARVVGFMNLVQTSLCADDNVTCTPGFLCTIGRYFEYFFSSVTLAHNGTVVSFVTNNGSVLESVTLNGESILQLLVVPCQSLRWAALAIRTCAIIMSPLHMYGN